MPAEFRRALYLPAAGRKSPWRRAFSTPVDIAEEVDRHREAVAAFLGAERFDATLAAFPLALSFLGREWDGMRGKRLYLEDELLLETWRREAAGRGGLPARAKGAWRRRQGLAFFRRKLRGAAGFICISEEERRVVRELFPSLPASLLKYGLPLEEYPLLPPCDPRALGFIGNYRHGPNLDAALWLVTDVFPAMAREVPGARLLLAGRDIPDPVRTAAAGVPGVELRENPGLEDFYRDVGVFVNPIREGRGLRTKAVEAAAFGRPVLSTPLGAEGLEDMRIPACGGPEAFGAAFRALQEPARYRDLAEANRRTVETRYSMEALGSALLEALSP